MTKTLIYTSLLLTTLLSLSSYHYHTAIGIDHDSVQKDSILHTYYRINWDGYGAIWIGYGTSKKPPDTKKPPEVFDPAAVFFKPVLKQPRTETNLQQPGSFALINARQPRDVFWLIIPAWLPILLSILLWLLIRRRNHSPNSATGDTTIPSSSEYK